jgi:hypothetical protein
VSPGHLRTPVPPPAGGGTRGGVTTSAPPLPLRLAGRLAGAVASRARAAVPAADLDDRDPDYIRDNLPGLWLLATVWHRADELHRRAPRLAGPPHRARAPRRGAAAAAEERRQAPRRSARTRRRPPDPTPRMR